MVTSIQVQSNAANMENAIANISRSKLVGVSPVTKEGDILDLLVRILLSISATCLPTYS